MGSDTLERELVRYARSIDYEDLDDETVAATKARVVDSVACAIGGLSEETVRKIVGYANGRSGQADSRILGCREPTSVEYAGFANGAAIRYLDWNDEYGAWNDEYRARSAGHPSCNIGTLLAAADAYQSTGQEFLRATVLAYEIQCRLNDVAVLSEDGLDHVNFGLVASTLSAGILAGLTEAELVDALRIAVVGHTALRQSRAGAISDWKGLAFGNAIRNALASIELAGAGIHGPDSVFEGEFGFFRQLSHPPRVDPGGFGGNGGTFKVTETNLKRYPICYHSQGAIDCVFSLTDRTDLDWREIESITIQAYDRAVNVTATDEAWDPQNRNAADHSLPYCVARAFIDGEMTVDQFTEEKIEEPRGRALMGRIEVERSEATGSRGDRPTHVMTVETPEETFRRTITYQKGHHENPFSSSELRSKARKVTRGQIDRSSLDETVTWIEGVEHETSFDELFELLADGMAAVSNLPDE